MKMVFFSKKKIEWPAGLKAGQIGVNTHSVLGTS